MATEIISAPRKEMHAIDQSTPVSVRFVAALALLVTLKSTRFRLGPADVNLTLSYMTARSEFALSYLELRDTFGQEADSESGGDCGQWKVATDSDDEQHPVEEGLHMATCNKSESGTSTCV